MPCSSRRSYGGNRSSYDYHTWGNEKVVSGTLIKKEILSRGKSVASAVTTHFTPEITLFLVVNRYSSLQMHGYTLQRFANNVA